MRKEKIRHGVGLIVSQGNAWDTRRLVEDEQRLVSEEHANGKLGISGKRSERDQTDVISGVETVAFFPRPYINIDTTSRNPLDNLAPRYGWKMRMKKSIQP
jgi:hypothetical protein